VKVLGLEPGWHPAAGSALAPAVGREGTPQPGLVPDASARFS
jgi:hypothetical protein